MRGYVVYQSRFGNARKIAEGIAAGLSASGHQVRVLPVREAPVPDESVDFLIVGGSTRMGRAGGKIRKYAARAARVMEGKGFATFSTGAAVYGERASVQASDQLFALLKESMEPLAAPLKAGVSGMKGPPVEGEEERAVTFGGEIAEKLG